MSGDLGALEPLFEKLTAKRGRLERLTKAERWLIATPADKDAREVSVEFNIGKQVNNLVVTTTGFEPGKQLMPKLAEHGVTTPKGWQLMADVGWVLGWRAPGKLAPERVLRFGFSVVKGLGLEPPDKRWIARVEGRPPRPGWQVED